MWPLVALVVVGAVGGGVYLATRSKEAAAPPPVPQGEEWEVGFNVTGLTKRPDGQLTFPFSEEWQRAIGGQLLSSHTLGRIPADAKTAQVQTVWRFSGPDKVPQGQRTFEFPLGVRATVVNSMKLPPEQVTQSSYP